MSMEQLLSDPWRCPIPGCPDPWAKDTGGKWLRHLMQRHDFAYDEAYALAFRHEVARELEALYDGRPRMRDWTLDSFPAVDLAGRRALRAARDWYEHSDGPLYLYGPPGSGKTGLAISLARQCIEGSGEARVVFENVRALLERQRERFARGESKALDHLLNTSDESFVVLDDLGAERETEFAVETIALIVEHLHVAQVPLVVTTNYAPAALSERLGDHDPVAGQRIVSRLVEGATMIRLVRPDLRTRRPEDEDGAL